MIYSRVTVFDVIDRAKTYGRLDNFGINGWKALFGYIDDLSDVLGEKMELDIIALCCEFARFEDMADYNKQYGYDGEEPEEIDEYVCLIDDGPAFICYAH